MKNVKKQVLFVIEAYICVALAATHNLWECYLNQDNRLHLDIIRKAMDCSLLNCLSSFFALSIGLYYTIYALRKNSVNYFTVPVILLLFYLLIDGCGLNYAEACFKGVEYNELLASCCMLYLYAAFHVSVLRLCRKDLKIEKVGGFPIENGDVIDVGWTSYSSTLLGILQNTDLRKECYTIGITGEWGTGKTTFLNQMVKAMDKYFKIIRFNPWLYHSASQIVENFFKLLSNSLDDDEVLRKCLDEYSHAFESINELGWISNVVGAVIGKEKQTVEDLKQSVNENILKSEKPIMIVIDDLDRLDKYEIIEVLRLIRISANFANLVFVVTFDAGQVSKMLQEVGIDDGSEYLKKMFQLEISLPGYEYYKRVEVLRDELKTFVKDKNHSSVLFSCIKKSENNHLVIDNYLKTFRDVKRFVSTFHLNYNQICKSDLIYQIDLEDFFWLEVIHYSHKEVYKTLENRPEEYMNKKVIKKGIYIYELKEKDQILSKINEDAYYLLYLLFSAYRHEHNLMLRYLENYPRYFCYRLPDNKLSKVEFDSWIYASFSKARLDEKLNYVFSEKTYLKTSIKNLLGLTPTYRISTEYMKNVLYLSIQNWLKSCKDEDLEIFISAVQKRMQSEDNGKEISGFLKGIIIQIIPKSTSILITRLLAAMWPLEIVFGPDEASFLENETFLSNEDIKELARINFESFITQNPDLTIYDLAGKSNLSAFMKMSIAKSWKRNDNDEDYGKINIVNDALVAHFSQKGKADFAVFNKAFEVEDSAYEMEAKDHQREWMSSCFGNGYEIYDFIKKCFDIEERKADEYMRLLGYRYYK